MVLWHGLLDLIGHAGERSGCALGARADFLPCVVRLVANLTDRLLAGPLRGILEAGHFPDHRLFDVPCIPLCGILEFSDLVDNDLLDATDVV